MHFLLIEVKFCLFTCFHFKFDLLVFSLASIFVVFNQFPSCFNHILIIYFSSLILSFFLVDHILIILDFLIEPFFL
jgi:hypothetical protein